LYFAQDMKLAYYCHVSRISVRTQLFYAMLML
jgi:hypothetical protein